jgi:hypothetical protein
MLLLLLLQFFSFIGVYGNMNAQLGLSSTDRDYIGSKGGIPSSYVSHACYHTILLIIAHIVAARSCVYCARAVACSKQCV